MTTTAIHQNKTKIKSQLTLFYFFKDNLFGRTTLL